MSEKVSEELSLGQQLELSEVGGQVAESEQKGKKKRVLEIVQQLAYLTCSPQKFAEAMEKSSRVESYALIVHDMDLKKDGTGLVEPHMHCVVRLKNPNSAKTVANWFAHLGIKENNIEYVKGQFADVLAYLIHANAPEKFQYADEAVISNFDWKKESTTATGEFNRIKQGIEDGTIREYNRTKHISMEMEIKYKKQLDIAFKWREANRISEISEDGGHQMDVVFISGESGAGKTSYAKELCKKKGYSYCVSSSGNDLLQDYRGQDALILDDLRGESMQIEDILKMLDNHTRSSSRSRYANKWLFECKLVVITSVHSIYDFFNQLKKGNEEEPREQFFRRCETVINMDKEKIKFFSYNVNKKEYERVGEMPNKIKELYVDNFERTVEKTKSFMIELGNDKPDTQTI